MSDKQLKNKAVKIQGKDYVLVSDRILYFNENYENGSIHTELLTDPGNELIVIRATVFPDASNYHRKFTGYSQERVGEGFINKTSALENAETSAVGRALAMMGIGVIESIASADEINKAINHKVLTTNVESKFATPKQIEWLRKEARKVSGFEHNDDVDKWIEETIGAMPQKLGIRSVMKAVERIQSKADSILPDPTSEEYQVTDKDLEDLKKGDIPY